MLKHKIIFSVLTIAAALVFVCCGIREEKQKSSKKETKAEEVKPKPAAAVSQTKNETPKQQEQKNAGNNKEARLPLVTFVELGSVNCIPCKMMKPVMEAVEKDYGDKVKVVFYDVWRPEGRPYAEKYGIRAIPTQVFLDKEGKEFFRHEGFYPREEIEKVLKKQGLTKLAEKENEK